MSELEGEAAPLRLGNEESGRSGHVQRGKNWNEQIRLIQAYAWLKSNKRHTYAQIMPF